MKIVLIIIGVLMAGVIVVAVSSSSTSKTGPSADLNISNVYSDIKSGGLLVDVRTAEEFSSGYIQEAVNIPLANIESGSLPSPNKDSKVYVYCRSGNRSAQAKSILVKAGYTNVVDLGGLDEVVAIGGVKIK